MNWKCIFGFHDWSKWYDIGEGSVSNLIGQRQPALYQERVCSKCNAKDRHYVVLKKG